MLDELDRELERRGHRFVRYADDCNIYVRSERAGHRVMDSITRFSAVLRLRVFLLQIFRARPSKPSDEQLSGKRRPYLPSSIWYRQKLRGL